MAQLDGIRATICDGISFLSVVRGEAVIRGEDGDIVSLIPLGGRVDGITTAGLEYPLADESLYVGPARGVSNVLTGPIAHITVRKGMLLVVHTPCHDLEQ